MTSDSGQLSNPRSKESAIEPVLHGISIQAEEVPVVNLRLLAALPCSGDGILRATKGGHIAMKVRVGQMKSMVESQVSTIGNGQRLPKDQWIRSRGLNTMGAYR